MSIAFHTFFPQFCREALNDDAWYPGFTDWDLIRKLPPDMQPRFTPAAGWYDLAAPADIQAQFSAIASRCNAGAALYHYFFDGRFVLDSVERHILAAGQPMPPFFLIWANESWTKRWIGKPGEYIVRQLHSTDAGTVGRHVERIAPLMAHPSYHRIDGRPLFILYSPFEIPSIASFVSTYRTAFRAAGLDPLLGFCVSYADPEFDSTAFDFCVEFQPRLFFNYVRTRSSARISSLALALKRRTPLLYESLAALRDRFSQSRGGAREKFDYSEYLELARSGAFGGLLRATYPVPSVPCSFYSWNNFPRYRERSVQVAHCPGDFEAYGRLEASLLAAAPWHLVNSWNEWSEGAALEPGVMDPWEFDPVR